MHFYKKINIYALCVGVLIFILPYKARGADEVTERNISQKLQQIHKYISKQTVPPSF